MKLFHHIYPYFLQTLFQYAFSNFLILDNFRILNVYFHHNLRKNLWNILMDNSGIRLNEDCNFEIHNVKLFCLYWNHEYRSKLIKFIIFNLHLNYLEKEEDIILHLELNSYLSKYQDYFNKFHLGIMMIYEFDKVYGLYGHKFSRYLHWIHN
jgi:hypothetical protein